MGCANSKLRDLPAVALCRDRCNFLQEALQQSYVFADAHIAYMHSLMSLGPALHRFFDQCLTPPSGGAPPGKHSKPPSPPSSPDRSPSTSNSDSHIQFDTDSEEDDGGRDFEFGKQIHHNYLNHENLTSFSFHNSNYRTNSFHQNYDDNDFRHNGSGWKTPPPPAPRNTAWDYLNFFEEAYERYGFSVRDSESELKDFSVDQAKTQNKGDRSGKNVPVEKKKRDYVKEKKFHAEPKQIKENSASNETKSHGNCDSGSVSESMRKLQVLFEKASESGNEVLNMLDTGKFRYHHKKSVYRDSSKMLQVITSNLDGKESLSPKEKIGCVGENGISISQNLSSTLKKLCMWEKKLHDEVKAEEKLRMIHGRKCRQMRTFEEKGGDAHKVDSTRTLIRTLSTKMRVAVQVIDRISVTINKMTIEELWPQISELIHRFVGMWNSMQECHKCQSQTVMEAKFLGAVTLNRKLNDADLEAAMQFRLQLQNWSLSFCNWIEAQKGYVKALNAWLLRCHQYEPEEIADGIGKSSSPDGFSAPPLLVILFQWSQAMKRLSEKEVIESMQGLYTSINQLLEQQNQGLQQRMIADKEAERRVKILEKEGQRMQKVMQAQIRRMNLLEREESYPLLRGETMNQSETSNATTLQSGLQQIFLAIEKVATSSKQICEELQVGIEECRVTQGNPDCP